VNNLWTIIANWHPVAQFLFLGYGILLMFGATNYSVRHITIMIKGWPPSKPKKSSEKKEG
jgi:hypothetical protein